MPYKILKIVLPVAATVLLLSGSVQAESVRLAGRVEVEYNKGNGLNQYYLLAPSGKVRVWAHILDPQQDEKESALQKAADESLTVEITGEKEESVKETTVKIEEIVFK